MSERLQTAIESDGRTFYRLGKEAGVSPEVISRFVAGERDIRLATASKLADVLGLELSRKKTRKRA
jgi:plasmid maintenance system antidote protein VapI